MKKFITKFILFLVLMGLCFFSAGSFYNHISPGSSDYSDFADHMPARIELAVIGSSHSMYGIKLEEFSEEYFNFSLPGQTPRYDLAMLSQFEDRIADGATILMTVSYMSPFWTEPESEFLEKQARYYQILSRENITDYDAQEAFRQKLIIAIPETRILYSDLSTVISAIQTHFRTPETPSGADKAPDWTQDIAHQQDVLLKKHLGLISPVFPQRNPDMVQAYEQIFAIAEAHNWRIIALTTPYTRYYNDLYDKAFDGSFYEVFYDSVEDLCQTHGIEYWDYSHDPRFTDTNAYFLDLDHLSSEGAEQFSRILAQRLQLVP